VEDVIAVSERPINKVLDSVEDYSQRGDEYRTKCSGHNGTSEDSLGIKEVENGDVLLHCHAGCKTEEIVEAYGLSMSDLFSKNGHSSLPVTKASRQASRPADVIAVDELPGSESEYFAFKDADDNLIYVQRHKGAFYRVVGFDEDEDPLFAKGLDGVEQTLFELPALLKAVEDGETIVHTEGNKDALNVTEKLGLAATTSGSCTSWKGEFAENYRGAGLVLVIPDRDEEGAAYGRQVGQDLLGVAETVKIIELPGLPEKGDVSDWLEAGHTAEEFFEVVEGTEALDPGHAWPEKPKPLDIKLPEVEEFDEELLPKPLRAWVLDVAKRMDNAAPDFVAVAAVVQAGALLGRKVGIYPKRHDDWIVIPNLWGGAVGPPSSMKTPALE
jgi:putative DNA primase/helicase